MTNTTTKKYDSAKKIVTFGGGTGHFSLLRGLVELNQPDLITAIVGTWDSGGSSGRLRTELGILPPGDMRQCLLALMEDSKQRQVAQKLFDDRLADLSGPLKGHSFGNLIAARLENIYKGPDRGIEAERLLFRIRARVLPVSISELNLMAKLEGGEELEGEESIDLRGQRKNFDPKEKITRIYFETNADPNPETIQAIEDADLIIFSAGDLYTSLLPHLLVNGIKEAIANSKAKIVLVLNLMTKRGETDSFKASDYLKTFTYYLGDTNRINYMVANSNGLDAEILETYKREGQEPVKIDTDACKTIAPDLNISTDALAIYHIREHLFRHDSEKLASKILSLS
ncbi:MAG: YvcK family protein [Candidatus Daviesbacteria bacterium]|nr:YvcK family protein [Candidatus Daviesbacteria bacterium]